MKFNGEIHRVMLAKGYYIQYLGAILTELFGVLSGWQNGNDFCSVLLNSMSALVPV